MATINGVLWDVGQTLEDHTGVDWREQENASFDRLYKKLANLRVQPLPVVDDFMTALRRHWDAADKHAVDTGEEINRYTVTLQALGFDNPTEDQETAVRIAVGRCMRCQPAAGIFPDAEESLERIAEAGLRQGAVSNTPLSEDGMRYFLAVQGLAEHLDHVITSGSHGYRKPHPSIYEEALRRLGLPAEQVVFVGDDPVGDVRVPRELGMKAILLTTPGQPPAEVNADAVCETRSKAVDTILGWTV